MQVSNYDKAPGKSLVILLFGRKRRRQRERARRKEKEEKKGKGGKKGRKKGREGGRRNGRIKRREGKEWLGTYDLYLSPRGRYDYLLEGGIQI